jgi:serine/threonine protein kinase/Tfp pilus assembly protein PilF
MLTLHQRAKELFLAALSHPAADRAAFVAGACGGDEALRREVESLLEYYEENEPSAPAREPARPRFVPGEVFAARYRMIARIGRGGMGDVWRADDMVLQTEVALKVIDTTTAEARDRILQEVRLARQITHPAVCRVFDVGEAEGAIFYSMELVRGEDLASLARRVGRLPSEKVADIGRQLCSGLAAAHAQGVLHRDLKPANVLIDDHGAVRITDFGIAIERHEAEFHTLSGTPAYMAPEQRTTGTPLSERTDLYALGLLLYELLVGYPAASSGGSTPPPRPSTIVANVHPQLERVVMQALSPDAAGRPASATEMAARLPAVGLRGDGGLAVGPGPSGPSNASWWMAGTALAATVAVIAIASSYLVSSRGGTLTGQDTIVLADFENTTGDPIFDGTLKVALAVALEQSPFLKVFPDERARETLRFMERSPDERVTRSLAREIARREQLKALIAGSIASLGRNYVITLEAVNAETGDVMAREQTEAATKEEVLASLGTATSRLRENLGESLASVQKFDVPLPRATTQSLDALHAYSLALYEGRAVPRLESIPHLKRAIELDPTFAMAHAQLSAVYANTGQSTLAPAHSRRAFELRDRVSERERFFISWRYYRDAVQAWDKALGLARSWTAAYPREAFAFNSLGSALVRLGQFDEAVDHFREAIRLDGRFIPAYSNLAATLLALDRTAEARAILQEAADKQLDFIGARRLSYLVAFVEGDRATMARELEASVGLGETNAAFGWQAHTSAFGGRVSTAHEQFRRGIQMSRQSEFLEVAAQLSMEDAETHAVVGQCETAREEVSAALELSRDHITLEHASRALALCGARSETMALTSEIAQRFPEATLTERVSLPVTAAALALGQREPARALDLLEPVRPYDRAPSAEFWPAYLRGQAYLALEDGQAAATEFRTILAHRGEVPASLLFPLSHLGLARAAVLENDAATARKAYQDFLTLWEEADPDLEPLTAARLEAARLQ